MTKTFQRLHGWIRILTAVTLAGLTAPAAAPAATGTETTVQCGDIVEGEFTQAQEKHTYFLSMQAGEVINFAIAPVGDFLQLRYVEVYEPAGKQIFERRWVQNLRASVGKLSARGTYTIILHSENAGFYHLHVGCTLKDGREIEPGAAPPPSPPPAPGPTTANGPTPAPPPPSAPTPPAAPTRGFPGLAPLDFSGLAFTKLGLGVPVEGTIRASGAETFGFRFDGTQGTTAELGFERTGGNLNLALVLLDRTDHVVFQASLVTSESLTSRLTLPTGGEYTLAVSPIQLLPPPIPRTTTFRVQVTGSQATREASTAPAPAVLPVTANGSGGVRLDATPLPTAARTRAPLEISLLSVVSPHRTRYRVASGLKEGATAFGDRDYIYERIPASLRGAHYVMTANDDKATDRFSMRLTASAPVTVYVAYDDRFKKTPPWLAGFRSTGQNVVIGGETHRLLERAYPAGEIVLGANAVGEQQSRNMYTVLLRE